MPTLRRYNVMVNLVSTSNCIQLPFTTKEMTQLRPSWKTLLPWRWKLCTNRKPRRIMLMVRWTWYTHLSALPHLDKVIPSLRNIYKDTIRRNRTTNSGNNYRYWSLVVVPLRAFIMPVRFAELLVDVLEEITAPGRWQTMCDLYRSWW